MMHTALIHLLYLRVRGMLKYMLKGLRSPKKAVFYLAAIAMICIWLGPQIMVAFWIPSQENDGIQYMIPFFMLLLMLAQIFTNTNERAVMFKQNEIDFLFPAPFARRELLFYKIITSCGAILFSATVFSLVLLRYVPNWFTAFLGLLLALLLIHLVNMAVILIRQIVDESFYSKIWQAALLAVIIGVVAAAWQYRLILMEFHVLTLLKLLYTNPYVYIFLSPFDVFGRLISTPSLLSALGIWLPLAVLMNAVVLAVVIRMDANYLEVSLHVSQKMHKRIQQVRRGGSVFASTKTQATRTFRVFPRWGGIGTIAWRQFIAANRNLGNWLFTFFLMAAASVCAFLFSAKASPAALVGIVLGILLYFSIFLSPYIYYDFRRDLDQFEWLKQLPIDSHALAAGQIVVPVVFLTLLECIAFSLPFVLRDALIYWIYLILLILPFNIFLVGVDNFVFLLIPTRNFKAQGDFSMIGKIMLLLVFKFFIFLSIIGVAAGIGYGLYRLSGYTDAVFFISTWCIAMLETLMVIPALAWAFDRFDVSSDIPPA